LLMRTVAIVSLEEGLERGKGGEDIPWGKVRRLCREIAVSMIRLFLQLSTLLHLGQRCN
jgi:hypothetical protein